MTELIVGGCSGSYTPAHSRPIFGHLTTSFGFLDRENKTGIIIDNGTGVQTVSKEMKVGGVECVTILQTHFHHDHIEGLQLNELLFGNPAIKINIIAPILDSGVYFGELVNRHFATVVWPVYPARISTLYHFFPSQRSPLSAFSGVGIEFLALNHPGGSVGYRFMMPDRKVIVVTTDNELNTVDSKRNYGEFVSGADVLIADCQYTQGEYDGKAELGGLAVSRRGWGHSTPEMLGDVLRHWTLIRPRRVLLTHHDPSRTDEGLLEFHENLCQPWGFEMLKP